MSLVTSWSYTALNTFENCPHRYRLEKVLKVLPFEESEAMRDGNVQHKHLEDRVVEGRKLPVHLEMMEPLFSKLEKNVMSGAMSDLQAEVELVLDSNLKPVAPYGQRTPKPFFMKNAWLRAKLDLNAISGDGTRAWVWDYKFGKFRPDNDQLELFAGIVFKYLPQVDRVDTGFIYPRLNKTKNVVFFRDGCDSGDEKISTKSESAIWAGWLGRVQRVEDAMQNDKWPCRPSGLCGWCPATPKQCPHSKK